MMCLKKKKAYEAQIEKISGANMTIQTQLMAIEGANFNKQTLEAMSMGARVMHDIHNGMYVNTSLIAINHHLIYDHKIILH